MNDFKQAGTENPMREGNEMIKALIGKVMDLGTTAKETNEMIRQLPSQHDALERWNQQSDKLAENIGKLEKGVQDIIGAFDKELRSFAAQMKGVDRQLVGMEVLQQALDRHGQLFEKPLEKSVHYRHFLGKPLLVLFGMGIVIGLMVCGWVRTMAKLDQYKANDYKWRAMELTRDVIVLHKVESIRQQFLADQEAFYKLVDEEQERRAEELEKLNEEEANHQDADSLYRGEKIK